MNNYISRLCILCVTIAGVLSFVSCEKDRSLDPSPPSDINEWIYKTMGDNYYWFDELPKFSSNISEPESFLSLFYLPRMVKKGIIILI